MKLNSKKTKSSYSWINDSVWFDVRFPQLGKPF